MGATGTLPGRGFVKGNWLRLPSPSALHMGSSQASVLQYLGSLGVEHSAPNQSGRILAMVREYRSGFLVSADMSFEFSFNSKINLKVHSAEVVGQGP